VSDDLSDGTERSRTLLGAKAAHQAMPHGGGSFRIERDCLIVTHERAYACLLPLTVNELGIASQHALCVCATKTRINETQCLIDQRR